MNNPKEPWHLDGEKRPDPRPQTPDPLGCHPGNLAVTHVVNFSESERGEGLQNWDPAGSGRARGQVSPKS